MNVCQICGGPLDPGDFMGPLCCGCGIAPQYYDNHASDCAHWAEEPCDCITGKDAL